MSQETRRLAAIMFTDIVGYTSMAQVNESEALRGLEEHRAILRGIFPRYGGREVQTIGDAFLTEFPSALEAVKCAIEIQRALNERNLSLPVDKRLQVRVGVHLGDVVVKEGDILGDAVNVSSRIEPLAPPGGVCISQQVYDHVRNKLGYPFEKLGDMTLKNVNLPVEVYRVVLPWESPAEAPSPDSKRVAVLPLKNLSSDPNDEYFADGMTEELITTLASLTGLTVISRTSVMQYKNVPKRAAEIGRELNVGTLVEGSVRKASNKVRITIQLINVRDEGHIWAQNYDKELDDVFSIQSEVAQKVAESLKVQLLEPRKQKIERGPTRSSEAHTLFLKGLFYLNKRTPETVSRSVGYFEQAVGLDPSFSLGYAAIAAAYHITAANYYDDPAVFFPKSKEFALKALSLDEGLAEAHAALGGYYEAFERDLDKAEAEFLRAIDLNPSYATAHQWYAQLLASQNRLVESSREITKAVNLSPLSLVINTNVADGYYYRKEYEKGIEQAKKVVDMDPNFSTAYPTLCQCYVGKKMYAQALESVEAFARLNPPADAKMLRAYVLASSGAEEESRKLLGELETSYRAEGVSPYFISLSWFALGDADEGFKWVNRAIELFDRGATTIAIDPELDRFRSDPRYSSALEKLGLAGRVRPNP